MDVTTEPVNRSWALAGAVLMAAAAALALVDALDDVWGAWVGIGAGVAGAAVFALVAVRPTASRWLIVAGGAAVAYLVLNAAPAAVSLEFLPVLRLGVSLTAGLVYLRLAVPLAGMLGYGLCCAALGVMAVFFLLWEPPPPKPVPIARPLIGLKDDLSEALAAKARNAGLPPSVSADWTGQHQPLDEATEDMLGADEYLNLWLSSPTSPYNVQVFVAYNANAMTNIPHVPWVCMVQSGFRLVTLRQDDIMHPTRDGAELSPNVAVFEPGEGMRPTAAVMFQYFNVGGTYEANRQLARILATSGSIGRTGSYLSQTQVYVYVPLDQARGALDRDSEPYLLGRTFLETLVPLLEARYYPDLTGSEGG
jgi:hypothetical protein